MLSKGREHKKVLYLFKAVDFSSFLSYNVFNGVRVFLSEHWHGCHCFFSFFFHRVHTGGVLPLICISSSLLRFPFSVNCHVGHVGPFVIPDTAKGSTTLY